jgi:adhesin/invasin
VPTATTQTIAKSAGDGQSAVAGAAVATAPSVKITNSSNVGVAGIAITFAVASGGGNITGGSPTTDAGGVATVGSWTLGQTAGANTLTATAAGTVSGSPVTFSATGTAGAASQLSKPAGTDAQQGPAGQNVSTPPAVLVRDQYNNAVANVGVTFAVATGGGSVTGGTTTTGVNGVATVGSWKLGNTPGANSLTATATGTGITGNPSTFTATANVGPPAAIAKVSGDNQTGAPGAAVALAPTVRVTDAVGNNVTGAGLTFAVASGGGSVVGGAQNTAADGTAKPTSWTLGATAGTNTLTATTTASGVTGSPLTFTATGGLNVATYAGTWSGTWTNTTYGSTGTTSIVIAGGGAANQVTLSHSGTGTVLGGSGAPLETRTNVPYSATAFSLTTVSNTFGNVTLNIDAAGNIVGSGTSVPNVSISRWDCTGTITATQIRLNFTVTFTSGSPAVGTIVVNKQ